MTAACGRGAEAAAAFCGGAGDQCWLTAAAAAAWGT